jgi:(heptosyl)LPS beta-1,4-glucosyltransferase
MTTLSVVLIIKNEAANLDAVLSGLQWADEIVVVDGGSDDDSVAIAGQYTDKVFEYPDWQGYGIQRQRAQSHASSDWIFMLDADERVTPELAQEIQSVVANNDQTKLYAVPRLSWVFGRFIRHSGWYPDYVTRLYPRKRAGYGDDQVHEKVLYGSDMELVNLQGDLLHYTYRDMEHYLTKSAQYAAAWAEQRRQRGKRSSLPQALLHGIGCFLKMYIFRLGVLDGKQGLLLALLSAHSTFVKYADLWVKRQIEKSD